MKLFGKLPQEQAVQTLVHDLNCITFKIKLQKDLLLNWMSNVESNKTKIYIGLEQIESLNKEIKKVQDEYYLKFKNDFNESI